MAEHAADETDTAPHTVGARDTGSGASGDDSPVFRLSASPTPHSAEVPATPPLVLLGASVRSLAWSASRAGFAVHAADLFADSDLRAVAREAVAVGAADVAEGGTARGYPWSLGDAAARFPAGAPWCYTGALENHPALIAAIAATRPLAGCGPAALGVLRDWRSVAAAAAAAGLAFPGTFADPAGLPVDGTFLVKPRAGAGGRGIHSWTSAARAARAAGGGSSRDVVWQRLVAGPAWSAAAVMHAGSARIVGVARQLIGAPWCGAAPFAWCGAVAPPEPRRPPFATLLPRLARELAARSAGAGLVGIDLVVDAAGGPHVIEVNPRPTASMELYERHGAGCLAAAHLAACGIAVPRPAAAGPPPQPAATWGKAVLFARDPVPVTAPWLARLGGLAGAWTAADGGWPAVADIPQPGQTLPAGGPIVSIFARGDATSECVAALRDRAAAVTRLWGA